MQGRSGLGVVHGVRRSDFTRELQKRVGALDFMHELAVVRHLCERLMAMQRGLIVEIVPVAALAAHGVMDEYTRNLMGASVGFRARDGVSYLATAFRRAVVSCRAGRPGAAKRAYNTILAALPGNFDALQVSWLIAS